MLKKTVTYEDFDGNTVTEDFYFNLTKAELMELEVSEKEGFSETMQNIIKANDGKEIIAGFKKILLLSIGKREGSSFVKNDTIREQFEGSAAFSEIFMELATNAEAGAAFVNSVIPKDLSAQAQAITNKDQLVLDMQAKVEAMKTVSAPVTIKDVQLPDPEMHPAPVVEQVVAPELLEKAAEELTPEQLQNMTPTEIIAYFQGKTQA